MLISIDERDPRPIYSQIVRQIKEQIQTGDLRPGDELPPVRELASSLGINLHTVRRAYQELSSAGLASVRSGRRARVVRTAGSQKVSERARAAFIRRVRELSIDGLLVGFTANELRELVRHTLNELTAPTGQHNQ